MHLGGSGHVEDAGAAAVRARWRRPRRKRNTTYTGSSSGDVGGSAGPTGDSDALA